MALDGEDCFNNNQYYIIIRRLLNFICLWSYLNSFKRLTYGVLISILTAACIVMQVYIIIITERKFRPILEQLRTFLPSCILIFAYWNLLYNSSLMKEILERVKNDWNELKCEEEMNIMQRYAAQGKQYSQVIACFFFFFDAFLIIPSLYSLSLYISGMVGQSELILPIHNEALAATKSIYFTTFVFQSIMIVSACIIGITNYSMYISLVQHACALLMSVANKIDGPFLKNKYKFCWTQTGSNNKCEDELEWIVVIAKKYNDAIKFFELIIKLYGKMYLVEAFFGFSILITDFIYFLQLLDLETDVVELLRTCIYINGSLLIIFAQCYLAEKLIGHSINVYERCCLVPFYTLSDQTNKLFLMLIMRSMKPCNISIGGACIISHDIFAKLMKTSFSFATVCYNLR